MANKNLNAEKKKKKDDVYTEMIDIERELQYYWPFFRGKVVFCNCDDPYESNFFKYFALHFNHLGLKKLICTCYNGSPVQGNELMIDFGDFSDEPKKIAFKVVITEVKDLNGDGAEQGVRGYYGKLDIRPPYQREFIYNEKEQQAVIRTVLNGYPLSSMYWVKRSDDAECPFYVANQIIGSYFSIV